MESVHIVRRQKELRTACLKACVTECEKVSAVRIGWFLLSGGDCMFHLDKCINYVHPLVLLTISSNNHPTGRSKHRIYQCPALTNINYKFTGTGTSTGTGPGAGTGAGTVRVRMQVRVRVRAGLVLVLG
jgi:hypothetical protein